MLIITKSEKGNFRYPFKLDFIFEQGDHQNEKYKISCSICDNPLCRCKNIGLECREVNPDSADSSSPVRKYDFYLDTDGRKLAGEQRENISIGDINFANAFIAELKDTDWDGLFSLFYTYKVHLTEECKVDELETTFNIHEIEEKHLLVNYHEIFPFAQQLRIEVKDKTYIVGHQYCLNSKCTCSTVTLIIIQAKKNKAIQSPESPLLAFDYRTGKWEIERTGCNSSDTIKIIMTEILAQTPGAGSFFKKRHNNLKVLYKNYLKKQNYPLLPEKNPVLSKSKTGRNDPCPCGSNKKHKFCCGV